MNPVERHRVVLWGSLGDDLNGVGGSLTRQGCLVHQVESLNELFAVMHTHAVDLVVVRLCRCGERPLEELLRWVREEPWRPLVLIVADALDVDLYLEAMRRGAFDCVGLPLNEQELIRIVGRALGARPLELAAARAS